MFAGVVVSGIVALLSQLSPGMCPVIVVGISGATLLLTMILLLQLLLPMTMLSA
jgi:hypothetical protein